MPRKHLRLLGEAISTAEDIFYGIIWHGKNEW
jgi:hypothetical protein